MYHILNPFLYVYNMHIIFLDVSLETSLLSCSLSRLQTSRVAHSQQVLSSVDFPSVFKIG